MVRIAKAVKIADKINKFNYKDVFIICSGSQGEKNGTLGKISFQEHKKIKITSNFLFITDKSLAHYHYRIIRIIYFFIKIYN